MNMKLKWGTAGRLRRGAVVLGVLGLTAGAAVATAGSALAANGTQPGNLTLNPASGATTLQPTWSTSTACPAGNNASAAVEEFNTDGTAATRISGVVNSPTAPITNATLLGTVGALLTSSNVGTAGTVEWAVGCYSAGAGTGTVVYVQSTFVTLAGANYSTSATGPAGPVATTTSVSATPNPSPTGGPLTLNATVTANSGTTVPAGTVQFAVGGTNVGTPVTVSSTGTASASTTAPATSGLVSVSATFVPTSATAFSGSSGTFSEQVGSLAATNSPVPVSVTVPSTGTLTVSVATGGVTLTPASPAVTPDDTASGTLPTVTITDTRNTTPGWSVSGQEATFTEAAPGTATIPGTSLGWTPAFVGSAAGGALIGGVVAPTGADTGSSGPGLGTAAVLAHAAAGTGIGTNTVNAALLLDIPATTPPGAYTGSLSITYVTTGP